MKREDGYFLNSKMIIGLAVIIIGVLVLLANLGYDLGINIWDCWPVILILIGLGMIFQPPEYRNLFTGSVFVAIGVLFLLDNLDIIDFRFSLFWPIILILIGITILRHGIGRSREGSLDIDHINLIAILGGGEYNYASKALKGGKIFAFMGGVKLNLKESDVFEDSMVIDVFTMMGGVEIRVPNGWQVTMHGVPILGGVENKTTPPSPAERGLSLEASGKRLIIKGMAIMGGIEVKN